MGLCELACQWGVIFMKFFIRIIAYILICLGAFFSGILLHMALETWGTLVKSGTENETIEQYIDSRLATHNDDGDAHMGVGQSIDVHRKETIIDHPAGSVLGDKYTNREFTFQPTFEDTGRYILSGNVPSFSIGGFRAQTSSTTNNTVQLAASGQYSPTYYSGNQNATFQFTARVGAGSFYDSYVVLGEIGRYDVQDGIGFRFHDGDLLAVRHYYDNNYTLQSEEFLVSGVNVTHKHIYRVNQNVDEGIIEFMVDGSVVHTMATAPSFDSSLRQFTCSVRTTTNSFHSMFISGLYISLDLGLV